jgi:hypothetical protein
MQTELLRTPEQKIQLERAFVKRGIILKGPSTLGIRMQTALL